MSPTAGPISSLGDVLLVLAFLSALGGMAASVAVISGSRAGLRWARALAWLELLFAVVAATYLLTLLFFQRYDIAYVYDYSSRDLNFFYRLSAFWAGQQGSFLLWLLLGAVLTVLQVRRSRQFEPYVLFFLLFVQAALTMFLLRDSPFQPLAGVPNIPADGRGLNPLLQNPWMVAHPPVLFVGYAGLAVPFAYALGGLWRRDYDAWVRLALPWALLGWFFLGLGIFLGAFWAYETLGWGGYWGWDLVENSSLIPWITATALVHAMLLQRYRRRLRHLVFLLAGGTFLLILYATFITRSGVLSAVSNHAFGVSALSPWMLAVLGLTLAASLTLFLLRRADIPAGPVLSEESSGPPSRGRQVQRVGRGLAAWLSRDRTFLVTILLLLIVGAPIWIGTLVPVITQIGGRPPTTFDVSVYPLTTAPWTALLLLVLCLCPLLGWQGSEWRRLLRLLIGPAAFALLATVVAVVLGVRDWIGIVFVLLGAFGAATNVVMVVRTARGGVLKLGGYLTHVGIGLLMVGIVASTMYSVEGPLLALQGGQPQVALSYRLTFVGEGGESEEQRTLWFDVERGSERLMAMPERHYNRADDSWVNTPYIQRNLTYDLYLAVEGYEEPQGTPVEVSEGQTVQVAGYTLTLQALILTDPYIAAVIRAEGAGISQIITPSYALPDTGAVGRPASLPGGEVVSLEQAFKSTPGLVALAEGSPVEVGGYRFTLLDLTMQMPEDASGAIVAGAVVDVEGALEHGLITPTVVVYPDGTVEAPPVALGTGLRVTLVQMVVEERAVLVQIDGLEQVPTEPGVALLQLRQPGDSGRAYVRLSLKPGMNLVWGGGLLLLIGTAVAAVRRWREVEVGG